MSDLLRDIESFFTGSAWKVIGFLATLLIGLIIVKIICKLLRKVFLRATKNKTISSFMLSTVRFLLYLLLLFVLAGVVGISMTPLITALGAVGLAVGLALQDSLSNIANGMLILSTKPFKVGDFLEIDGQIGTVKAIRLITVELLTPDNRALILPNSKVISSSIINYSARPTRRIEFVVSVMFDSDARKVKKIAMEELRKHPLIMDNPEPVVYLSKYKENLEFLARGWVETAKYWDCYWELHEKIYFALTDNGIKIPHGYVSLSVKEGRTSADKAFDQSQPNKEDEL